MLKREQIAGMNQMYRFYSFDYFFKLYGSDGDKKPGALAGISSFLD